MRFNIICVWVVRNSSALNFGITTARQNLIHPGHQRLLRTPIKISHVTFSGSIPQVSLTGACRHLRPHRMITVDSDRVRIAPLWSLVFQDECGRSCVRVGWSWCPGVGGREMCGKRTVCVGVRGAAEWLGRHTSKMSVPDTVVLVITRWHKGLESIYGLRENCHRWECKVWQKGKVKRT